MYFENQNQRFKAFYVLGISNFEDNIFHFHSIHKKFKYGKCEEVLYLLSRKASKKCHNLLRANLKDSIRIYVTKKLESCKKGFQRVKTSKF